MEYRDYLQSDDWLKKRALKRAKCKRCGICGSTENLDTHHLTYRNLYDVKQSDLRVLCHRCHFLGHELMKQGKMKFKGESHHSKFSTFKWAVKKELGLGNRNLFRKD